MSDYLAHTSALITAIDTCSGLYVLWPCILCLRRGKTHDCYRCASGGVFALLESATDGRAITEAQIISPLLLVVSRNSVLTCIQMLLFPREKQTTARLSHCRDGQRVLRVNFVALYLFKSKYSLVNSKKMPSLNFLNMEWRYKVFTNLWQLIPHFYVSINNL